MEFMQRFLRLAGFLGAAAGTDEEQAKNFQCGLRRSTLNHLMCMSYTDVAQVANVAHNYEILHESDDEDTERPDKRQKSGDRHQPTSQQSSHRNHSHNNDRHGSDRRSGGDNHRSNNNYSGNNKLNLKSIQVDPGAPASGPLLTGSSLLAALSKAREDDERHQESLAASYINDTMCKLHDVAKDSGITILGEMGLDPRIDRMMAISMINQAHAQGGKVRSFVSNCGGIPSPTAANNPLA
nr:alpha-aminoadipic semialdehyde synthase isoform X1 [Tanacetum cinerariifolium]